MIIHIAFIAAVWIFSATQSAGAERMASPPPIVGTGQNAVIIGDFNSDDKLKALLKSVAETSGPLFMIIDSNGGNVDHGMQLLQLMRAQEADGRKFICLVPRRAISMGFYVLLGCSERYATKDAQLLWHQVRVTMRENASITAGELRSMLDTMSKINEVFVELLKERLLGVSPKYIEESILKETMRTPDEVNKLSPGFAVVVDEMNEALQIINGGVK